MFALELPRAILRDRIDRRVLRFFEAGSGGRGHALCSGPKPLSDTAAQAIGYREVIAMLAGDASLDQTIDACRPAHASSPSARRRGIGGCERFNPCLYFLTRLRRPSPRFWRESSKTSRSAIIPRAKTHTAATGERSGR